MVKLDITFAHAWPFGILKSTQWVSCMSAIICVQVFDEMVRYGFLYDFLQYSLWILFVFGVITWLCYMLSLQHETMHLSLINANHNEKPNIPSPAVFEFHFPLAEIDFMGCLIGSIFSVLGMLICSFIVGKYLFWKIILHPYIAAFIFYTIATWSFAHYAYLLYKSAQSTPNKSLSTVIIDGNTAVSNANATLQHLSLSNGSAVIDRHVIANCNKGSLECIEEGDVDKNDEELNIEKSENTN